MSKRALPVIAGGKKKKQKRLALRAADDATKAGGKKQRQQKASEEDHSDNEDDDEDDGDISNTIGQTEDINFEFSDMKEDYFSGVRMILNSQISNPSNTLPLAEAIIQQDTVGTVVNCEGEVDVFAYATLMPLDLLRDTTFFAYLRTHFNKLTASSSGSQQTELQQVVDLLGGSNGTLGLCLQGRFTNVPLPLIYQLHHNLQLDIEWTKTYKMGSKKSPEEVDEPLISKFKQIQQIAYFAPVSVEDGAAGDSKRNVVGASNIYFDHFEDECYFTNATHAYIVESTQDFFKLKKFVFMVVPLKKLNKVVDEIKTLTNST